MIHPRNGGRIFGLWDSLGNYVDPLCNTTKCCKKNCSQKITNLAKEINIGPAMFLMTAKQLMVFFFVMTIINIPNYFLFHKSSGGTQAKDLVELFSMINLGSFGK